MRTAFIALLFGAAVLAAPAPASSQSAPPAMVLGEFVDDYGGKHTVTVATWMQGTSAKYRIVAKRDTPRTGCHGFPFSRMKRASKP